jgi:hypothetical protein
MSVDEKRESVDCEAEEVAPKWFENDGEEDCYLASPKW